jgi:Na+/H+ antiporter NhaD/arsenite permease-like protein
LLIGLLLIGLLMALTWMATAADGMAKQAGHLSSAQISADLVTLVVLGQVTDAQGNAVEDAEIALFVGGQQQPLVSPQLSNVSSVHSEPDGLFRLVTEVPAETAEAISAGRQPAAMEISAHTFGTTRLGLRARQLTSGGDHVYADVGRVVLPRIFNAAFFVTVLIFVGTFVAISLRAVHETIAAMAGATLLLAVTYLLGDIWPDLHILDFGRAMHHIDFDVIFLILGLMIFVAITGRTGIFQNLAYKAYVWSGGRPLRLAIILVVITAVSSAFLNNVTVMLLIAPVTVEIALVLGVNPLAFLLPEVLASNIGGTATLIGDPPNTLIGSYAHLGFNAFLANLGPIVVVLLSVFIGMMWLIYRREYRRTRGAPSATLAARLAEDSRITDPMTLRRAGVMAIVTLLLFFVGDLFAMPPAVAAMIGAVGLMIWTRPNVHDMIQEVDWTTLLFFMSLFILVGALQDVGAIQLVAEAISDVAGDSLAQAIALMVWVPAIGSAITENIPFTAAMLPVTGYLTQTVPGAGSQVLWWALALGACLGGNATLVGAAANIVASGVSERAGYPLPFKDFAKVGIPTTFVILVIATAYLLVFY